MKSMITLILSVAAVAFIVFCWAVMTSPELKYSSTRYKFKAKIVFWAGNVRLQDAIPYFSWSTHDPQMTHKLDLKEARTAKCRAGDIGLHRDSGYLSNVAIPGTFKHAWIHVGDREIVEAVSQGVLKRDELYPLLTDYAVILRPNGLSWQEIDEATTRAKSIVGCKYDANFKFDFEEASAGLKDQESEKYCRNIKCEKYHAAFSCTETVGYAFFPFKKKLNLFRSMHAGREAIIADDYLKMNFDIVWLSPSVTVKWAEENGLHEQGRQKIADYWAANPRQ